ncbi:DinB family protein [Bacillus horti]|uniref:Damage-inducible protein DinB n=1 Tax=Caldalkalibacillus horti TaxID=77523 RepID=A0ABT9W5Q6_9BACI|nr:DinB family protein [Bacillus horti]MDQ0168394.1 putative damage-inducible protein DinB [Bacillus horti]
MKSIDFFLKELADETESTRRVLQRIPEQHLSWSPHSKSMSLGQLALHVAVIPGAIAELLSDSVREIPDVPLNEATSLVEIEEKLDKSVESAKKILSSWSEEDLNAEWRMVHDEQTVLATPRRDMLRSTLFNHWYHHRGQLLVYLRLLDVPVPAVYGSSADEQ